MEHNIIIIINIIYIFFFLILVPNRLIFAFVISKSHYQSVRHQQNHKHYLNWSLVAEISQSQTTETATTPSNLLQQQEPLKNTITTFEQESSPRNWLESQTTNGAYTVLRCDLWNVCSDKDMEDDDNIEKADYILKWRKWGNDFHLQRLQHSIQSLVDSKTVKSSPLAFKQAVVDTESIMSRLLSEATKYFQSHSGNIEICENYQGYLCTFMMTILWQPAIMIQQGTTGISVRGHVFVANLDISTLVTNQIQQQNKQLLIPKLANGGNAVVAISPSNKNQQYTLPNRYMNNPQSKLSCWCQRRKPLEEMFKRYGIQEVLLVQEALQNGSSSYQLLEGLTTNVFVVDKNGTLRTNNNENILFGYARELVLQSAKECGIKTELKPLLLLDDASSWSEVFLTSSIRLIIPLKKIQIPSTKSSKHGEIMEFEDLWTCCRNNGANVSVAEIIYNHMVSRDTKYNH